jgi:hypothetical protein
MCVISSSHNVGVDGGGQTAVGRVCLTWYTERQLSVGNLAGNANTLPSFGLDLFVEQPAKKATIESKATEAIMSILASAATVYCCCKISVCMQKDLP